MRRTQLSPFLQWGSMVRTTNGPWMKDSSDEEDDEVCESLPDVEKIRDPLWRVRICSNIEGVTYDGIVWGIETGHKTRERVYLIKYMDGDFERMSVEKMRALTTDRAAARASTKFGLEQDALGKTGEVTRTSTGRRCALQRRAS